MSKDKNNLEAKFRTKIGMGFDAHKFGPHNANTTHIMLCGIPIPCKYSIIAHSDGDVALHALTDALLGAIAAGDIGMHFPPNDPKWKNAPSEQFVIFAKNLIMAKGGIINNVDITIISQTPKISEYRDKCRTAISRILEISIDCVSVKATTTDHLGFTGREEGLACQAVASVLFVFNDA